MNRLLLAGKWLKALVLLAVMGGAQAHDSWFAPMPSPAVGDVRLALGTGNAFPEQDSTVGDGALCANGCRHGLAAARELHITRDAKEALHLRTNPPRMPGPQAPEAISCWAQMPNFELEVTADKVPIYLDEINASPSLRATWEAMRARGLPWRERYVKSARYEWFDPHLRGKAQGQAMPAQAAPLGLDIVLQGPLVQPRVGDTLRFVLLRDGQPLPELPLELRHEKATQGVWMRSDAQGAVSARLLAAGRWLLRAVDLRLDPADADRWDSRFVTLSFSVGQARK